MHDEFFVEPRENFVCETNDSANSDGRKFNGELPKLFHTYMRFGAKVCRPPAIDREFKTIDFLVIFDMAAIDEKYRKMFFA